MFRTIIPASLAGLAAAAPALADSGPGEGYHGHMWGGGYGMGTGLLGGGLMLLFWVAIIVGTVFLVRWLMQTTSTQGKSSDALEILRQRLAKGEIDAEEFAQRKRVLED